MQINWTELKTLDSDTQDRVNAMRLEASKLPKTSERYDDLCHEVAELANTSEFLTKLASGTEEGGFLRELLMNKVVYGEQESAVVLKFKAHLTEWGNERKRNGKRKLSGDAYRAVVSQFARNPKGDKGEMCRDGVTPIVGLEVVDRGTDTERKREFYRDVLTGERCLLRLQMVELKADAAADIAHIPEKVRKMFPVVMYAFDADMNRGIEEHELKAGWEQIARSVLGWLEIGIPVKEERGFSIVKKNKNAKSAKTRDTAIQAAFDLSAKRSAAAKKGVETRRKRKALAEAVESFPATGEGHKHSAVVETVAKEFRGEEWGQRITTKGEETLKAQGIGQFKSSFDLRD